MKAVSPVRPQDPSSSSSSSPLSLHYLSKQSLNIARCRMEEEDLFCLQYDMNDCYSRLKRLVPTIPQDKKDPADGAQRRPPEVISSQKTRRLNFMPLRSEHCTGVQAAQSRSKASKASPGTHTQLEAQSQGDCETTGRN
ncbi:hypothetical protein OJAV_G00154560 [Oryzias javanicus]|uniref:DNA-binding protein inhibitor ID-4 n=1 Tax=Oryzias javanicus TaxID=123683 RepID=A0A3S2MM13_ORYJA|nr:hypothetical protein OJAV_G00154560 [Oryzias javanicus]